MLKKTSILTVLSLLFALPSYVYAEWDVDAVKEVSKKLQNNEEFSIHEKLPMKQEIGLKSGGMNYIIDFNVKDCFVVLMGGSSATPYSCKKIKESIPLFSSLITWE